MLKATIQGPAAAPGVRLLCGLKAPSVSDVGGQPQPIFTAQDAARGGIDDSYVCQAAGGVWDTVVVAGVVAAGAVAACISR